MILIIELIVSSKDRLGYWCELASPHPYFEIMPDVSTCIFESLGYYISYFSTVKCYRCQLTAHISMQIKFCRIILIN